MKRRPRAQPRRPSGTQSASAPREYRLCSNGRDARIRASREEAARRRAQALLRAAEAKALTDDMNIQRAENYQLMLRERAERRAEGAVASAAQAPATPAGRPLQPVPPSRAAEPVAEPSAPRTPGPRSARVVAAHT